MRGLMRAARWFLAPAALATAVIAADGQLAQAGTPDPAALIQLGIPDVDASFLRLDVLESAEPCGYGNVTVNDQILNQDGHGRGSGSLMLEEGSTFMARWNFSCVDVDAGEEPEQLMEVAVDLVDGTAVADLHFAVRFRQTAPVQVLAVDGVPSVVTTSRPAAGREADDQRVEPAASEVQRLKAELERMTQQKLALEKAILDKQYSVGANVADCHVKASTKLRKCHSPRCLVSAMYHKIKNAAGISSQHSCSAEDADESPIRIAFAGKDKERPLVAISEQSRPQPPHVNYDSQQQSPRRDASSRWRRVKFFLLFLPAGVAVLVLVIVLGVKHANSTAPEDAEKQARRRERRAMRRQAQEERRAALQARFEELKRRFRERFALRSSSVEDEEKDAMVRRDHATAGDDSGSESDSDASTTMEQELASFRNIADVVGSMVSSAAEGRPRAPGVPRPPSPKYHHYQQRRPPGRPGYAFSDCGSVDEELPSYDEGVIGASHVADGFRYAPGGRGPWPAHQAASPASPLDEVLGSKD